VNYKRKSRRRFFLLMRSRTPPISSEFLGRGGFEHPKLPPLGTPLIAVLPWNSVDTSAEFLLHLNLSNVHTFYMHLHMLYIIICTATLSNSSGHRSFHWKHYRDQSAMKRWRVFLPDSVASNLCQCCWYLFRSYEADAEKSDFYRISAHGFPITDFIQDSSQNSYS